MGFIKFDNIGGESFANMLKEVISNNTFMVFGVYKQRPVVASGPLAKTFVFKYLKLLEEAWAE